MRRSCEFISVLCSLIFVLAEFVLIFASALWFEFDINNSTRIFWFRLLVTIFCSWRRRTLENIFMTYQSTSTLLNTQKSLRSFILKNLHRTKNVINLKTCSKGIRVRNWCEDFEGKNLRFTSQQGKCSRWGFVLFSFFGTKLTWH